MNYEIYDIDEEDESTLSPTYIETTSELQISFTAQTSDKGLNNVKIKAYAKKGTYEFLKNEEIIL